MFCCSSRQIPPVNSCLSPPFVVREAITHSELSAMPDPFLTKWIQLLCICNVNCSCSGGCFGYCRLSSTWILDTWYPAHTRHNWFLSCFLSHSVAMITLSSLPKKPYVSHLETLLHIPEMNLQGEFIQAELSQIIHLFLCKSLQNQYLLKPPGWVAWRKCSVNFVRTLTSTTCGSVSLVWVAVIWTWHCYRKNRVIERFDQFAGSLLP